MNSRTMKITFNAAGFQAAWWVSVVGVMQGRPWIGPLTMALYLAVHFLWVSGYRDELKYVLISGLLGTAADTVLRASGLVVYGGGYGSLPLAPLWITGMWMGFTASLHHALAWMKNSDILGFLMGAVFGPLSYYTGYKFGVLEFGNGLAAPMAVLALLWGFTIPLLYRLGRFMGVGNG